MKFEWWNLRIKFNDNNLKIRFEKLICVVNINKILIDIIWYEESMWNCKKNCLQDKKSTIYILSLQFVISLIIGIIME